MVLKFGSGLKETFMKIAHMGKVDKEAVETIVRDVQRVLLQSDVNVALVSELSARIRKHMLEDKPPAGMTLRELFLKSLYDELVGLLGKEKAAMQLKRQRILLIGLFGSGKTTTAAKLGRWFKVRGLSVGLVACDVHRPAAQDQLRQLGQKLGIPVYSDGMGAEGIAKAALSAKEDVLIFDSAGRDALDGELANELKAMAKTIKPDETLLVMPADMGQDARRQSEEFSRLVGITGLIVTKMDGTAKGGGVLASASVTSAKVRFIGVGEKVEDFEEYDPNRFFSRLVGYGDIEGLLEKAKEAGFDEAKAKEVLEGEFTLEDFIEQTKAMKKMGSLSKVAEMIPGMGAMRLPAGQLEVQQEKMERWQHIISSMTKAERKDPELINAPRVKRIAKGSGTAEHDVREMLKYYKNVKKIVKVTKGGKAFRRGPLAKLAKQMGLKM